MATPDQLAGAGLKSRRLGQALLSPEIRLSLGPLLLGKWGQQHRVLMPLSTVTGRGRRTGQRYVWILWEQVILPTDRHRTAIGLPV